MFGVCRWCVGCVWNYYTTIENAEEDMYSYKFIRCLLDNVDDDIVNRAKARVEELRDEDE